MQPCWTPIHSLPCNAGRSWNRIKSTRTDKFNFRKEPNCHAKQDHIVVLTALSEEKDQYGLIMSRDSWPHQPGAVCVYSLQLLRLVGSSVLTLETLVCSPQQQGTSMIWWLIPVNKRQLRHATWMYLILSKWHHLHQLEVSMRSWIGGIPGKQSSRMVKVLNC